MVVIIDKEVIREAILRIAKDGNIRPPDMAQVTLETGVEMFASLRKLDMSVDELRAAFLEEMGALLDEALANPHLTRIAEKNHQRAKAQARKDLQ